jgi:hypothetical protein
MRRSVQISLFATCCGLGLFGCFPAVTEFKMDPETHKFAKKTYRTDREYWEALVERRIQAEIHGERPDVRRKTWPQFWREWYLSLRHNKDGEERIAYIRAKRKEHGLDPY